MAKLVCCLISLREIQKFDRNNSFNKHVFISKQDLDLMTFRLRQEVEDCLIDRRITDDKRVSAL